MPLTVITLKNSPPSLRGDLTKWMQEISTGVYVGNFSTRIREELWKRVVDSVGTGEATMSYAYRNEIGYRFATHNATKIPIDYEGIPLVLTPAKRTEENEKPRLGFSKAAKIRQARKYADKRVPQSTLSYVVLDLETTGLNPIDDRIIEIGAVKIGENIEEYHALVKQERTIPEKIQELTGIREEEVQSGKDEKIAIDEFMEWIGDNIIVGYNVRFDIKFLNEALKRQGKGKLTNQTYDVMQYVKKEHMFLKNYHLETVLQAYDMENKVPHRALEDAKLTGELAKKVKELMNELQKKSESKTRKTE